MSGRIVETEAYPPGDSSGHAYHGRTASNQSLFLGKGFAHVYFIYGTSYMLNVAAEEPGVGAGVPLRAMEPLEGIDLMKRLRKRYLPFEVPSPHRHQKPGTVGALSGVSPQCLGGSRPEHLVARFDL
jgi:3-methyladenine DNA glycosylase Mpg